MIAHNWIAARNAYAEFGCTKEGIGAMFCYETGAPIHEWCSNCIGHEAVHILATQQTLAAAKAFGPIKDMP